MDTLSIKKTAPTHTLQLLSIVVLAGLILHYIVQEWVLVPEVYYRSLESKLSDERIQLLMESKARLFWVSYLLEAVYIVGKLMMVALLLVIGAYFFEKKLSIQSALKIAAIAALIPLVAYAMKIFWFSFGEEIFTLKEFKQTQLLSLQHLLFNEAPIWLSGILSWLSLFEIAYWGVLCAGISRQLKLHYTEALGLVASSYGVATLLYLSLGAFAKVWVM